MELNFKKFLVIFTWLSEMGLGTVFFHFSNGTPSRPCIQNEYRPGQPNWEFM